ncbi:MAG: SIMPL domain-containing protein [Chloroflexi bacterium]|nr:SIMPL domain-containing protein [Chloroflexota bacterium]
MVHKRGLVMTVAIGVLALGLACSGSSTPTPGGNVSANGGVPQFTGTGGLEVSGSTGFATPTLYGGQQSGIWVNGTGRVTVTPDLGLLDLGVEARATTVAEAREQAATAMTSIMDVLGDAGIEERDIRTQFFNIQPEYVWNETKRQQEIVGYRVTNTVNVKVRDLEAMGTLIDQVATAGGDLTRINSIRFTVEDTDQFAIQAREAAVKQAMEKAQQFAQLTNSTLGKLAYIAETGVNVPVVRDFALEERVATASAAPPTPISQGEMEITVTVQAVFAIS